MKPGSMVAGMLTPDEKAAVEAGLKLEDAKGGKGLTPPVPVEVDHGLSKFKGVVFVPCRSKVGAKGALSAVWL